MIPESDGNIEGETILEALTASGVLMIFITLALVIYLTIGAVKGRREKKMDKNLRAAIRREFGTSFTKKNKRKGGFTFKRKGGE